MSAGLHALSLLILAALWAAYGWPAALVAAIACVATFIATTDTALRSATATVLNALHLDQEDPMPTTREPSPTASGVLRRRAARFMQLGILASCVPNDDAHPAYYTVVTAAGDVHEVPRRDMPAYLDGLAHGHRAAGAGL